VTLTDQRARDRIERDFDTTFVVEAAAGTGKTTALVARVVSLLRSGRTPLSRIVAVTFTEKAAGEMKLRLRAAIEEARSATEDQERGLLDRALAELEVARIGTIHSLCADLLRERPVEAGIDPQFEVAPDDTAGRLFEQAFEEWYQRALADPPEGVRRVLRRPPGRDGFGPRQVLRAAGWKLQEHRDYRGPWRRDPFDRDRALDRLVERLAEVGDLAPRADRPDEWLTKHLWQVNRWVAELRSREEAAGRDYDGLEASLRQLRRLKWQWKGYRARMFDQHLFKSEVIALRDAVKGELDHLLEQCDADLAPCLHQELWPLIQRYEELKRRAGKLDFLDLLHRTRDLLVRDRAVRHELQQRFTHLLVDEFQDNDPLQTEIVLLLASAHPDESDPDQVQVVPGKLFLVGDPKQSIYRFRRADVAVYHAVKRRLLEQGAEVLHLSTSFRSDPRIQQAVNAAFAPRMEGGSQAEYVPLEPFRASVPGRPAVVALPVPEPYSNYGRMTKWAVEKSAPDAVGAWVQWLLNDSGWEVSEPGAEAPVPVQARHVCLLFRRFQTFGKSVTEPYTRALESRQVPHVLVGGRSFHAREEVLALRNALTAIEWPDDELAVFATLRGPLFAVGDDALLAWRGRFGRLHPLRPLPDDRSEVLDEVAGPLQVLAELHRRRNRRPVADTVVRLLDATRAHAALTLWSGGEQTLANVLRVVQQAHRFEAAGATSFRAFVDQLAADAERGDAGEAPVVEEGTEGVRIMTVHKAKGLEFPVVVLCDVTCSPVGWNPTRYVDSASRLWAEPLAGCVPVELVEHADEVLAEDAAESDRLLYVAATRARDVLVVPAVGDEPCEGWVDPLHPVIYPERHRRGLAVVAEGCPPFGEDTVLRRPMGGEGGVAVRPGLHTPQVGPHKVVWWDPGLWELKVPPSAGVRHQAILVQDERDVASRSVRAHTDWVRARAERITRGTEPSVRVHTPTELAEAAEEAGDEPGFSTGPAPGPPVPIVVEDTDIARAGRPHGKRFGTLVHAVLADIPLDADAEVVRHSVALHGRMVGATTEEFAAAEAAVKAALRHPLLREAAASPDCRREVPLTTVAGDGTLVEGTADLAFRDLHPVPHWTVVDFKTDLELDGAQARYEAQVGWYVRAVEAATGELAEGVLLRV
jgi:ATP-dependent exoDNAse (exonuclease V) beta subunit